MKKEFKDIKNALSLPEDYEKEESIKIEALQNAIVNYIMKNNEIDSDNYNEQLYEDACLYEQYIDPETSDGEDIVGFINIGQTFYQKIISDKYKYHEYLRIDMICAYVIQDDKYNRRLGTYQWYGDAYYNSPEKCDEYWDIDPGICAHDEHTLFDLEQIAKFILEKG